MAADKAEDQAALLPAGATPGKRGKSRGKGDAAAAARGVPAVAQEPLPGADANPSQATDVNATPPHASAAAAAGDSGGGVAVIDLGNLGAPPADTSTLAHGAGHPGPEAGAQALMVPGGGLLETPAARRQAPPVTTPERSARPPDLFTEARAALGLETPPVSRYFQSVGLFAPPGSCTQPRPHCSPRSGATRPPLHPTWHLSTLRHSTRHSARPGTSLAPAAPPPGPR